MINSQDVSASGDQQKQTTSLEDKIALLTTDIEALRTQITTVERSLASLWAATGRFARREGAPDCLLRAIEVAVPGH
jgi:septal ring factor EnvC (AmiA/AmiB activator)